MSSPYATFGLPSDPVAWTALGAGLSALALALWRPRALAEWLGRLPTRTAVGALALAASLLSLGYLAHYLRWGPRIIDATSYYLEARMLADGGFSFAVPEPDSSFRGRFLLPTPGGDLTVIFPPGYPAFLALGFLVHAPLAIGPLLGGALVVATYALTKTLSGREDLARLAALLSAVCAALRYHTADTMSHGFAALLLALGLAAAARGGLLYGAASGLCIGWLIATRPVSGLVGALLALTLLVRSPRRLAAFGLALAPGLALLAAHQHTGTGDFFGSTQLAYYARSDGPPGCFRYGFGQGVGCLFEHGDFVRARLQAGYGWTEALANTLRRLALHSVDIANAFPLAAVVVYGAFRAFREPGLRLLVIGVLALIAAYVPFYFDGSYPGAGARLFAEALPLEHGLLAYGLSRLRAAPFALPAALLGFSLHQSHAHLALREREGGHPMFEADALLRAGVTDGLVFVATDHGFNLGHRPNRHDAANDTVVARLRGDARDRLLWERLGRPRAYRYDYDPSTIDSRPKVLPFVPPATQRFEAEADWPPLAAHGWTHPDHSPCASGGRVLRLRPVGGRAGVLLQVQTAQSGAHDLLVGWSSADGVIPELTARFGAATAPLRAHSVPAGARCGLSNAGPFQFQRGASSVWLEAGRGVRIDHIELVPRAPIRLDSAPERR